MSVFLFHVGGYLKDSINKNLDTDVFASFISHGHVGVQLFFVISGFVIALPFAKAHLFNRESPRLKNFFTRRFLRLEPPYFINLIVSLLLVKHLTLVKTIDMFPHLLASMFYMHNVFFSSMSTINCVAWSLEVEFQFYILAPFFTYLFTINNLYFRRGAFAFIIIAFALTKALVGDGYVLFNLSLLSQAQFFFTGFLLLDVYLIDWKQIPEKKHLWDIASVISWICIAAIMYKGHLFKAFIVIQQFPLTL